MINPYYRIETYSIYSTIWTQFLTYDINLAYSFLYFKAKAVVFINAPFCTLRFPPQLILCSTLLASTNLYNFDLVYTEIFGAQMPWLVSCFYYKVAVGPWVNYLTSVCFFICKMGIKAKPISWGCKDLIKWHT